MERRRERYMILYVWSILEGIVPNLDQSQRKVRYKVHIRHGRKCIVPIVKRSAFREIIASTLPVHGVKLFNALPKRIRDMKDCSKEKFKEELDKHLLTIPDEPQILRYTAFRRAESNSILDMIKHASVGLHELTM